MQPGLHLHPDPFMCLFFFFSFFFLPDLPRLVCKRELSPVLRDEISPDQLGYMEGRSTSMALIKCQHHWLDWLDKDADFVRVLSFDFSKALDSVSHRVLCDKLKSYDINPYIINWLISFLCDRQQRVVVDGVITKFLNKQRCPTGDCSRSQSIFHHGERHQAC